MTCEACAQLVYSKLNPVAGEVPHTLTPHTPSHLTPHMTGVRSVYVDVSNEVVLVETCLLSCRVQALLEETGRLVVFRGFGGTGTGQSECK